MHGNNSTFHSDTNVLYSGKFFMNCPNPILRVSFHELSRAPIVIIYTHYTVHLTNIKFGELDCNANWWTFS